MEEIPLAAVLEDGMMSGPSHYWREDDTLIGERSVGIVAHGIAEQMTVAGGVREIILSVVLVHP